MFNGIIRYTGKISKIYKKKNNCIIEIVSKMKFTKNDTGSSIACSGVCLTLEKYNKNLSKFYLSKETLNKTIFNSSKKGDVLNLEKPLKYGDRISGHFIQGHVDTISVVKKICCEQKQTNRQCLPTHIKIKSINTLMDPKGEETGWTQRNHT